MYNHVETNGARIRNIPDIYWKCLEFDTIEGETSQACCIDIDPKQSQIRPIVIAQRRMQSLSQPRALEMPKKPSSICRIPISTTEFVQKGLNPSQARALSP